jgi:acyl-CoA hydrolase
MSRPHGSELRACVKVTEAEVTFVAIDETGKKVKIAK